MSRNEMSKRFDSWREIDKTLTTYMPLKDKERELKEKDSSKPVSIVFPLSRENHLSKWINCSSNNERNT
jgi:hypothetical protein